MARTNLCPNPSLANDATGWFGGGVRVTGSTGMSRATAFQNAGATTTLPRATVTAGLTYRFSAYVKGTGGGSSGNVNINWYSGGAYLASAPGQGWTVTTGQVARIESGAQVAPAGADQALLNITGVDAQIQVTAVLYEQTSSLFEFFDGDSGGCSWTGTSGNSTSTNPVGDSGGDTPPPDPGQQNSDEAAITQGWGSPIWQSDFAPGTEGQLTDGTWGLYDGPGHAGNGTRDPERISITDGVLRLQGTAGGSGAGMAHRVVKRRYGRWEARMRAYSTGGTNGQEQWHPVLIVWPDSDNWPVDGEYDFIESDVGDTAGANMHYPHPTAPPVQQEQFTDSSKQIADYHNYAIDWQPTGITGYIDGVQWYHVSGGAGPAGRSNIQAMPSGHLTVQLDNFGGSPHRPANMDVDWVRIYDNTSVASNNSITVQGIPAPNDGQVPFGQFGPAVVGTRFRLYLTNTSSGQTVPVSSEWEQSAGAVTGKSLGRNRGGSNTAVTVAETSTSNTFDSLLGQWISDPFTSSGTVQGAWQICVAASESNTAADSLLQFNIRIMSGDLATTRGLFSYVQFNNETGTILSSFIATTPGTFTTPIAAQLGDRMVLEVGYRATNTVATSYSATLRYGGPSLDLESGLQDATITANSPWIEFADGAIKALFTGQTVIPTGIASANAFGAATVVVPPTRALSAVGAIASAEAVPSPVVRAEAYPLFPSGFGGETFGALTVTNSVTDVGIATAEAFGAVVVRRLSDLYPTSIASAEAFGALVLVHFQQLLVDGILSAEAFGNTQVEDPHRNIAPFAVQSVEQFGIPTLSFRMRTTSIVSAESVGKPTVKRGAWKLVQPTREERWRLGGPNNVIYVRNVVGLTVLGNDAALVTVENPRSEQLASAKYVWLGGRDNITEDQAIRNLWAANGYQVEMFF
jgi:hypothetical protein